MDLTPEELRVLGSLLEKQRTTPDVYPLTLNALRAACNQSTNRDPVVAYDEETVREAMARLSRRRWARLASGARAAKYRHLLEESLTSAQDELALLCVLMLRGPQTPGELKLRTERMHPFAGLEAVHQTLRTLIDRGLVIQRDRRPGQKEERYAHLLGADDDAPSAATVPAPASASSPSPAGDPAGGEPDRAQPAAAPLRTHDDATRRSAADEERIAALEREVQRLSRDLASLRASLGEE